PGGHRPEAQLEAGPGLRSGRGARAGRRPGRLAGRPLEGSGPAHGGRQPAARPAAVAVVPTDGPTEIRACKARQVPTPRVDGPDFAAVRAEFALPAEVPPDALA